MVNIKLPYEVKLVRAPVHTVELLKIITNKQKRSMHKIVADAVEYYYDNCVAVKRM